MLSTRRVLYLICSAVGVFCCAALAVPGHVAATTGPTHFLPAPKYKVNNKIELLYTGQYVLKTVAQGARLSGGAMGVEIDSNSGALYGVVQFYGYDQNGQQSTWVGTLYNFRQTGKQTMEIEIVAPAGAPVLGRLFLTRSAQGDLSGQIQLPSGKFPIVWHKLSK